MDFLCWKTIKIYVVQLRALYSMVASRRQRLQHSTLMMVYDGQPQWPSAPWCVHSTIGVIW